MTFIVKIRRQDGAIIFSIPAALLKMLGAEVGTRLVLSVTGRSLVATPAQKRYTLAQLLDGADEMAKLNRQASGWQGGFHVGNEAF